MILQILLVLMPWSLRRRLLQQIFGYQLHPTSFIGRALAFPKMLILEEHAKIGNLTICRNLDLVHLKPFASIGKGNWITGFPTGTDSKHFSHETDRKAELILGTHSAITNRHLIDATNRVTIGAFTTVAGFQSQLLTHSIDLISNQQSSAPISIGDYCFVGTNCVLLGGSVLPTKSVLGAKSMLNKAYDLPFQVYAGVPARPVAAISPEAKYFQRTSGFVE